MKKTKHVIVLSLDAVGSRDFDYMKELPAFSAILKNASCSQQVSSVYPSLTYPAHTSIVTGKHPVHHGIINNTRLQPQMKSPDWFWQRKYIKGTTLYDEVRKKGLSTAALLWPVTGRSGIRYNLPEILPNRPWQNQVSVCMTNGSIAYELELNRRFGHIRKGVSQPALDDFVCECMLHTVKKYKPGLLLVHLTDVDTNKHLYGTEAAEVREAFKRHDRRLDRLVRLLETEHMTEDTTLVILGDHSQYPVEKVIYPNHFLWKKGLINIKSGRIRDWKAYAHHCDGSCYIYARKGISTEEKTLVSEAIRELKQAYPAGIQRVCSGLQAGAMGADKSCACMLEAGDGYYFLDEWDVADARADRESGRPHMMYGTHGYHPEKPDYQTFFLASGAGIRSGVDIGKMSLVDEGPTIAALLDCELSEADGRILSEILEK